jgi:hypothetical protein
MEKALKYLSDIKQAIELIEDFTASTNSFNDYFGQEHAKLLNLWRTVVSFRRSFSEMKSSSLSNKMIPPLPNERCFWY